MNFAERIARYRRLQNENEAWKLLRADNAPLVLAFLGEIFRDQKDVPIVEARADLEPCLDTWRSMGIQSDTEAGVYIRQWIDQGYLREQAGILSMSDAASVAIGFAERLERRDLGASASNLRLVQDLVQDLAVDLSMDREQRVRMLQDRRRAIEREIEDVIRDGINPMSEDTQRERIRGAYQQARLLSGNFRFLEEEIRRMDQVQRQEMIENAEGRGLFLERMLDELDLLKGSNEGRAFLGFFELLADTVRSTEFRGQLKAIVDNPATDLELNSEEKRYLRGLVRELNHECKRLLERRTRAEQGLRAYIGSGAFRENKRIEQVIKDIQRLAAQFPKLDDFNPRDPTSMSLASGKASFAPSANLRLREAAADIVRVETAERPPGTEISDEVIDMLLHIRHSDVAERMLAALLEHGPQTLGTLAYHAPVELGLEEVVVRLRIARDIGGISLEEQEWMAFAERDQSTGRALLPSIHLEAKMFPDDLTSLNT